MLIRFLVAVGPGAGLPLLRAPRADRCGGCVVRAAQLKHDDDEGFCMLDCSTPHMLYTPTTRVRSSLYAVVPHAVALRTSSHV